MLWSETWRAPEAWLAELESAVRRQGAIVVRGGDYESWDLSLRGGLFGGLRCLVAVEEHGAGRQLIRLRSRAHVPTVAAGATAALGLLAAWALAGGAWLAGGVLAAGALGLAVAAARDCAAAAQFWAAAVDRVGPAGKAGA